MKSIILFVFFIVLLFFTGCSSSINNIGQLQNSDSLFFSYSENKKSNLNYNLTKNEKEFLSILNEDKYASLCSSHEKYLKIKKLENSKEKSYELKELFFDYTYNLANSCIDQESFKRVLSQKKYKSRKQNYELYNQEINKEELIKKFESNSISVEKILSEYSPSHPKFFNLIKKLDINKLSKSDYNRLRLNIERIKLLKEFDSTNFIQLNIPSYNFTLYEYGEVERVFGTIVGKRANQTPVLSSKLSHFIINPAWNIPDSIAKKTIIPNALKDRNYLRRKNIVIRKGLYDLDAKPVAFSSINWKKYLKKNVNYIPYKFIQMPSRTNGMGRVKFMFPNDYAVYMHDTIGTWRFKRDKESLRLVSHGCVRLEHPISFMKHITKKYTPKTYKSIRQTYLGSKMRTVNLSKKLPVHITYLTSYIKDGELKFYNDVYEYDKIQKLNYIPYESAVNLAHVKKQKLIKHF